jgi:hypothetical protein
MEVSLGFQSMVVPPNHPVFRPWLTIDEQHLTTMMTWGSLILGNHIGFFWVICFPSIFQHVQTNGSLFSPCAHPTRLGFQTGHDWARPSAPLGECCAMVSGSRGAQTQTWSYLRFQSCLIIRHNQIICKLYCFSVFRAPRSARPKALPSQPSPVKLPWFEEWPLWGIVKPRNKPWWIQKIGLSPSKCWSFTESIYSQWEFQDPKMEVR